MAEQKQHRRNARSRSKHLPGLWHYRAEANLTQGQLAEKAGISRPYLSILEWQDSRATIETAKRIADALGVTVSDLEREPKEEAADLSEPEEEVVIDFAAEGFSPLLEWSPEELDEYQRQQQAVYERCVADDSPEVGMMRGALAAALAARSANEECFGEVKEAVEKALRIGEEIKVGEARA